MNTKTSIVLLSAAALALPLAACTKTETVGTGPTTVAASAGTSPGTSAPTGKTDEPAATTTTAKKTGTTKKTSGAMEPGTHKTEFDDGTAVDGKASCSFGNDHLRLILEGFEDDARVTIDVDPQDGAEVDEGEYVLRSKTGGTSLASGPASLTASVFDTKDEDGKDAQGLAFSYSARYKPTKASDGEGGTVTGSGACIVEGDRIGGDAPPTGSSLSMPVTDAVEFTENLVKLAVADADVKQDAFGAPDIWVAEGLPKSALTGYGNEATPEKISGFATVSDKNGSYQAYPFAVTDGTKCIFAVIYTTEDAPKPVGKVFESESGPCTGSAALDTFESTVLGK